MSLAGERLVANSDPGDRLHPGEVRVLRTERVATSFEGTITAYEKRYVSVGDVSKPQERLHLDEMAEFWNAEIAKHPEWPTPTKADNFQTTNPAFDWFYSQDPNQTSMIFWRDNLMPNAPALYPLQKNDDAGRLFPGGYNDQISKEIFLHAKDSLAIRARATILREIGLELASRSHDRTLDLLSLGAGAGVSVMDLMHNAYKKHHTTIFATMIDHKHNTLTFGGDLARERGIPVDQEEAGDIGHISLKRADYRVLFPIKEKGGAPETFDIVEILGLFEYLSRQQCVEAIRESYKLLKPGGSAVVSNMRTDRPQLHFYEKGIAWPDVVPRSEQELIAIAVEAGVNPANITITVSEDGVYSVMEIRKP